MGGRRVNINLFEMKINSSYLFWIFSHAVYKLSGVIRSVFGGIKVWFWGSIKLIKSYLLVASAFWNQTARAFHTGWPLKQSRKLIRLKPRTERKSTGIFHLRKSSLMSTFSCYNNAFTSMLFSFILCFKFSITLFFVLRYWLQV